MERVALSTIVEPIRALNEEIERLENDLHYGYEIYECMGQEERYHLWCDAMRDRVLWVNELRTEYKWR
jgi:hypothetical protein